MTTVNSLPDRKGAYTLVGASNTGWNKIGSQQDLLAPKLTIFTDNNDVAVEIAANAQGDGATNLGTATSSAALELVGYSPEVYFRISQSAGGTSNVWAL